MSVKKTREERLASRRANRILNREILLAKSREYTEKNRGKLNAKQREKRAIQREMEKLLAPPPEFTDKEIKENRKIATAAYKKQWRIENIDRIKVGRKIKYKLNKDHAIKKAVEWNQKNPDKRKKIIKSYELNNPDKVQSGRHNRRVREKAAEGTWCKGDIAAMFDEQKGLCAIGGLQLPKRFEVDHIKPLVLGGYNGRPNLQLTCPYCNRRKGGKHPDEFAKLPFKPCKSVKERNYQARDAPA